MPDGQVVPPHVPGLRLDRWLGSGAHGVVWSALDPGTGETVAVKLCPRSSGRRDREAAARLAQEMALLRRIDHPHVIRLRRVLDLPDGSRALVLDHAEGGSLRQVVGARGPLRPGEIVTVVVPIAQALAELHDLGLVHGDLNPGNVLFTADGRPLLADFGLSEVHRAEPVGGRTWDRPDPEAGPEADPEAGPDDSGLDPGAGPVRDVRGLGALVWFALTGSAPGASLGPVPAGEAAELRELAAACLDGESGEWPTAVDVAHRAWRIAPALPVGLRSVPAPDAGAAGPELPWGVGDQLSRRIRGAAAGSDPSPAAGSPGLPASPWRRVHAGRRPVVAAALLVLGLAVASVWGLRVVRPPARPEAAARQVPPGASPAAVATTISSAPADEGEWRRVLADLARGRAEAFRTASTGALAAVDEPGSPAMAADAGLVSRLRSAGLHLEGVAFTIRDVQVVTGHPVTVRARVSTSAHRQVRTDGAVIARVPGPAERWVRLVLVPGPSGTGWRVRAVD